MNKEPKPYELTHPYFPYFLKEIVSERLAKMTAIGEKRKGTIYSVTRCTHERKFIGQKKSLMWL